MTLRNAAEQFFDDPEKPSVSQQIAYFESLRTELKSLGFSEPVADGEPVISDRVEAMIERKQIRLLGKTVAGIGGYWSGALLDISLKKSPGGNISIVLHSDSGSAHVSEEFPQGITASGRYLASMSPTKANDEQIEFKWSEREMAERAIATWVIQNADVKIANQLRPVEMPKPDLRRAADKQPG